MKACTWSQSFVQNGKYFSSHFTALALSLRYAYPYPRLRNASICVFLSAGDCARAAWASFTAPAKSRAISLSDEDLASFAALDSFSFGLGPSRRAGSAFAVSCGWHCDWSACASALVESKPSTRFASARQASCLPAVLAADAFSRCFFAYADFTWSPNSCIFWHHQVSDPQCSSRLRALSASPAARAGRSELYESSPCASSAAFFLFGAGVEPAFSYMSSAAM